MLYARVRGETDPVRAHDLWRNGRDHLFATHPQSPLMADDPLRRTGLPYWPYDPALRWKVSLTPAESPRTRVVDTGGEYASRYRQIGWATVPAPINARLAVWWLEGYGGGLFLPIRDATAGHTSYGGGRYLLDTAKGADLGGTSTEVVIDLNFLYHPSCRYDPRWVCPLAPVENTVSVGIAAGERVDSTS